jgi:hypothetical protein
MAGGLDSGVMTAVAAAQTMAEWATESLFAPLFFVMEAMGYTNGKIAELIQVKEAELEKL